LSFTGLKEDFKLGLQLEDLHVFIDLHVAVLLAHAPVKQLVEVDVAVVTVDGHLQKLLLKLSIVVVFCAKAQTGILLSILSQMPEEFGELVLLDLVASVSVLCKLLPHNHKSCHIILKHSNHIFFWEIILLELLDDNEDEQI